MLLVVELVVKELNGGERERWQRWANASGEWAMVPMNEVNER